VTTAEKVFKVRDQWSGSQRDQMHFCGGGIHFDGGRCGVVAYLLQLSSCSGVASYGALGHMPLSTSNNFISSLLRSNIQVLCSLRK